MKIAVTGASGFIGRHVLPALSAASSVEVVASSRSEVPVQNLPAGVRHVNLDIGSPSHTDYDRLGRPDVLVHLAWAGLPNYRSLHHFETELPRQYAFLRSLVEAGLPSLLVAGTCYEYGMRCGELDESMTAQPANPYAYAKNALRQQLEFLRSKVAFKLTWARLFYVYGEGQAATSLYPQLISAIDRGDPSFKMSGGEQLRDYLKVAQAARLIADLAIHRRDADIVNICSGNPISVRVLVENLLKERGSKMLLSLGHFPYPDYEPLAFWGSIELLQRLTGSHVCPA